MGGRVLQTHGGSRDIDKGERQRERQTVGEKKTPSVLTFMPQWMDSHSGLK